MAASLPAIDFIIEGVEADVARLAVSAGRPKDEWKALFVAAIALGWERLTDKLPGRTTTGGDFVNFLSAAWASLPGGEPPEINLERPIRRGLRWAQTISREIAEFARTHPEEANSFMPISGAKSARMTALSWLCTTEILFSGSKNVRNSNDEISLKMKG